MFDKQSQDNKEDEASRQEIDNNAASTPKDDIEMYDSQEFIIPQPFFNPEDCILFASLDNDVPMEGNSPLLSEKTETFEKKNEETKQEHKFDDPIDKNADDVAQKVVNLASFDNDVPMEGNSPLVSEKVEAFEENEKKAKPEQKFDDSIDKNGEILKLLLQLKEKKSNSSSFFNQNDDNSDDFDEFDGEDEKDQSIIEIINSDSDDDESNCNLPAISNFGKMKLEVTKPQPIPTQNHEIIEIFSDSEEEEQNAKILKNKQIETQKSANFQKNDKSIAVSRTIEPIDLDPDDDEEETKAKNNKISKQIKTIIEKRQEFIEEEEDDLEKEEKEDYNSEMSLDDSFSSEEKQEILATEKKDIEIETEEEEETEFIKFYELRIFKHSKITFDVLDPLTQVTTHHVFKAPRQKQHKTLSQSSNLDTFFNNIISKTEIFPQNSTPQQFLEKILAKNLKFTILSSINTKMIIDLCCNLFNFAVFELKKNYFMFELNVLDPSLYFLKKSYSEEEEQKYYNSLLLSNDDVFKSFSLSRKFEIDDENGKKNLEKSLQNLIFSKNNSKSIKRSKNLATCLLETCNNKRMIRKYEFQDNFCLLDPAMIPFQVSKDSNSQQSSSKRTLRIQEIPNLSVKKTQAIPDFGNPALKSKLQPFRRKSPHFWISTNQKYPDLVSAQMKYFQDLLGLNIRIICLFSFPDVKKRALQCAQFARPEIKKNIHSAIEFFEQNQDQETVEEALKQFFISTKFSRFQTGDLLIFQNLRIEIINGCFEAKTFLNFSKQFCANLILGLYYDRNEISESFVRCDSIFEQDFDFWHFPIEKIHDFKNSSIYCFKEFAQNFLFKEQDLFYSQRFKTLKEIFEDSQQKMNYLKNTEFLTNFFLKSEKDLKNFSISGLERNKKEALHLLNSFTVIAKIVGIIPETKIIKIWDGTFFAAYFSSKSAVELDVKCFFATNQKMEDFLGFGVDDVVVIDDIAADFYNKTLRAKKETRFCVLPKEHPSRDFFKFNAKTTLPL